MNTLFSAIRRAAYAVRRRCARFPIPARNPIPVSSLPLLSCPTPMILVHYLWLPSLPLASPALPHPYSRIARRRRPKRLSPPSSSTNPSSPPPRFITQLTTHSVRAVPVDLPPLRGVSKRDSESFSARKSTFRATPVPPESAVLASIYFVELRISPNSQAQGDSPPLSSDHRRRPPSCDAKLGTTYAALRAHEIDAEIRGSAVFLLRSNPFQISTAGTEASVIGRHPSGSES
ncbi:hypothetical protein B0H15DRAFT_295821 [Mycena belliarum]|uniref:Uncharacterized protein n=1 Tax=Mycena belliarum TaxID=1033014 RepID=A0AAD6U362_9AGAR|nr:hypothetical protein B0H15DRAFT_295821 [Mycena belliae]